jgi:hypothetical protein
MDIIYTTRDSEVCDAMNRYSRRARDRFQQLNDRRDAIDRNWGRPVANRGFTVPQEAWYTVVRDLDNTYQYVGDFGMTHDDILETRRFMDSIDDALETRRYAVEQAQTAEAEEAELGTQESATQHVSYIEVMSHFPRWRGMNLSYTDHQRLSAMTDEVRIVSYLRELENRQGRVYRSPRGRAHYTPREQGEGIRSRTKEKLVTILGRTNDLNLFLNNERNAYTAEFISKSGDVGDYVSEDLDDLLDNVMTYLDAFDRGEKPEFVADTSGSEALEAEVADTGRS